MALPNPSTAQHFQADRWTLAGAAASAQAGGQPVDSHQTEPALWDPAANLTAYIKLRGSLADEPVVEGFFGQVLALVDGAPIRHLFDFVGFIVSRYRRVSPTGCLVASQSFAVPVTPAGDRVLVDWLNPLTGKATALPPFGHPAMLSLVGPGGVVPGDASVVQRYGPAGLREHNRAGQELVMYEALAADPDAFANLSLRGPREPLLKADVPCVRSQTAYIGSEPWRPFMAMERQPGRALWLVAGTKLVGQSQAPRLALEAARTLAPDRLEPPARP